MGSLIAVCAGIALILVCAVLASASLPCDEPVHVPYMNAHPYVLGDSKMNITEYTQPSESGGLTYRFLNLHENENTSVVAAKTLLYQKGGGSIVYLEHGGTRNVEFTYQGVAYQFDPNRMFTAEGIRNTLQPFNAEAGQLVSQFADAVLGVYNFSTTPLVIALHNNSPSYSALDYLPGGPYANDASNVSIGRLFTPRDFFYIADDWNGENLYRCLTGQGFSAVLQSNASVTNDGSLSVYCAMNNKSYVNVESAAASGSTGTQVVNQLILLDHLTTLIEANSDENTIYGISPDLFLLGVVLMLITGATFVLIVLGFTYGYKRARAARERLPKELVAWEGMN